MKQHEFERLKRDTEIHGAGHKFPSFDNQEQEIEKNTKSKKKKELEKLRFSYIEIESFTQIVGGELQKEFSNEEHTMLFMERNMAMIHNFTFHKNGAKKKNWSQMIQTVDRIYYKQ